MSTKGRALRTPQFQWEKLRAAGAVDGASLLTFGTGNTTTGYSFSDVDGTLFDVSKKFGNDFGMADIAFYTVDDAINDVFGFQLWGWRQGPGGHGFLMCEAAVTACIVGAMVCPYDPVTGASIGASGKWVDTISITNYWAETCTVYDSAADRIAYVKTNDLHGMRYLKLMIYAGSGGINANNIGAIISVF